MMKTLVRLACGLFLAVGITTLCGCHESDRGHDSGLVADADGRLDAVDAASSGVDAPADAPDEDSMDSGSATDGGEAVQLDAISDVGAADVAGCFSLFHACATTSDCCSPYRCINITGDLACQLEGPVVDGF